MRNTMAIGLVLAMVLGCVAENYKEGYSFVTDGTVRERLPNISSARVKKLQFEGVKLSKDDMATIGSFRNLEYLRIDRCDVEDGDFQHIAKLTKLKRINIASSRFTDADIGYLQHLPDLESIRLGSKEVSGTGLESLTGSKTLRSLELYCPIEDDAMKHVATFDHLQLLWVTSTRLTDAGLMRVSKNYCLKNLEPPKQITINGLRTFRKTLLEGRKKARAEGLDVPPDDELFIQVTDPEIRGRPYP